MATTTMTPIPDHIMQRLRTCTSFPTPPPVALQVLQLAQNPDIDLAKVADAVSADPAIAAKIMRIANSAMYARRRQSANLRQALITLGLNATLTLALSFTLVQALRKTTTDGFDFQAYWRRTVLSAAWGKLIANEVDRSDAEDIFLASLLQDLGMLVVFKLWPEVYEGIAPFRIDHPRICQHEQNCIGTDHRAIGAALLKIWNMPEHLVRAVRHSHDPAAAGVDGDENREFVRIVALSGELSDMWLGTRSEVTARRVSEQAHRYLGITPKRLAQMFDLVQEQLPVAAELFQMDLYDPSQLQDITEAARETLMLHNVMLAKEKGLLEEENSELKTENVRDPLTNTHNRRYFEEALAREFETAAKHGWPLSVVFVDIDKFKSVNDGHGHQAGDAVLQAIAGLLRESLRDADIVARYGGDEFVLLLPGVDAAKADTVGTRICASARLRPIHAEGKRIQVTLSVGIATMDAQKKFESAKALVAAADSALYESKHNGRDRYTCFGAIRAA